MLPRRNIRSALQLLFGLLLVCWPGLDTAPTGAVTGLRIALGGGMLLLLVAAIITAGTKKRSVRWSLTDWAVLACTVWYVGNVIFIGRGQTDPYNLLTGLIILAAYVFCRLVGTAFVLPAMLVSGLIQAGIATAQLWGIAATRHSYYDFTGSFPNPGPLGGWLCVAALAAVVLTLRFWKRDRRVWAVLCAAGGLYVGIILLLTDSRAAWLGFIVGGIYLCSTAKLPYRRAVLSTLGVLAIVGAGLLYGYKKDSADGRLLVWRVSADMIVEKPVMGHGIGTFSERYMFAQADYFERHSGSRFANVAEQVSYPFNELIGAACEIGIVGALLFLSLIGPVFLRRGNPSGKVLLIGLSVFGLFSYPSAFLGFGLLFAALLADERESAEWRPNRWTTRLLLNSVIIGAGITLLFKIATEGKTGRSRYVMIREASDLIRRSSPDDLPRLEQLAQKLPIAGFYVDLGDLYLETDSIRRAKYYYQTAAWMISSRLRPYDGLFRAYLQAGQADSAALMARHILSMPVKVSNTATIRIRRDAKEWLEVHGAGAK